MDRKAAAWQLLLSANLPPRKLDRIAESFARYGVSGEPLDQLLRSPLLTENERERLRQASLAGLEAALEKGIRLLTAAELPERAGRSPGLPPAFFCWGDDTCLASPSVAIVGTRGASVYGKAAAQKFAEALSECGVTLVSGGALGIDAVAHEAALSSDGKTVAVLACGIDRSYPAVHKGLFARIRESGCLFSQFPLGFSPRIDSFLARNTAVAALSDAVVVIEAPEGSGSLTTANAANELGKQVFVVPANISSQGFRGSHDLIRHGATLVDHPDQILEDLRIEKVSKKAAAAPAEGAQAVILATLGDDPMPPEKIAAQTGLDASALLSELTLLELDGRVIRAHGGYSRSL